MRSRAAALVDLAAMHGITDLTFASPGRLRGPRSAPFKFERAVTQRLSAEVELFSDEVLRNEHFSPDLVTAAPL